jgi:cytochrome c
MRNVLPVSVLTLALAFASPPLHAAETPMLGRPVTPEEVARADLIVTPDGANLPPGSGTPREGQEVFAQKCLACHGEAGQNGPQDRLTGGIGTIGTADAVKTVASYWPHATTVFDYIRRAMPANAPQSLTNDEVYAVTGYLLSIDGIVAQDAVLNAETLPGIEMPNREGFIPSPQPAR